VGQAELLTFERATGGRSVAEAPTILAEEGRKLAAGRNRPAVLGVLSDLGVSAAETVSEADAVLDGSCRAFGSARLEMGAPPRWHTDPVSGLEWPRDVWWSDVDFRFDPRIDDPRYVWEINRHLHLGTLARAFVLTGDERYARGVWFHMVDWVRRNPPHFGINWASPLEAGIRLISWTLAMGMVGPRGANPEEAAEVLTSCSLQARHVSDNLTFYGSSRNNHLIGEAAGLLAAGTALPFLDGADAWTERALRVLEREVPAQIAPDGISLEQTFHYQAFVIEFALVTLACARALGVSASTDFLARVASAADALDVLADGATAPPDVGDADGGRAYVLDDRSERQVRSAAAAASVAVRGALPARTDPADLASAVWLFGPQAVERAMDAPREEPPATSKAFRTGGYFVLGDGSAHGVVDCGPLGLRPIAAHGHADCLALEVARDGDWLLVDPGTYCYHRERSWRDHFRSTRAHNTLTIDGADQSEILGPFLWGARAEARATCWAETGRLTVFSGRHDGYVRRFGVTHSRTVALVEPGIWIIFDSVSGQGEHTAEVTWQLAGGLAPVAGPNGPWRAFDGPDGRHIELGVWGSRDTTLEVASGALDPPAGWISGGFGRRTPAPAVTATMGTGLPASVVTVVASGVAVDADVEVTDTGARVELSSGAETVRLLFGAYRQNGTDFSGTAALEGPAGAGRHAFGADVARWYESGRAVDFEPVPNALSSGAGIQRGDIGP
jgi:hypothetical protein